MPVLTTLGEIDRLRGRAEKELSFGQGTFVKHLPPGAPESIGAHGSFGNTACIGLRWECNFCAWNCATQLSMNKTIAWLAGGVAAGLLVWWVVPGYFGAPSDLRSMEHLTNVAADINPLDGVELESNVKEVFNLDPKLIPRAKEILK